MGKAEPLGGLNALHRYHHIVMSAYRSMSGRTKQGVRSEDFGIAGL